jgi:hypothetical protein
MNHNKEKHKEKHEEAIPNPRLLEIQLGGILGKFGLSILGALPAKEAYETAIADIMSLFSPSHQADKTSEEEVCFACGHPRELHDGDFDCGSNYCYCPMFSIPPKTSEKKEWQQVESADERRVKEQHNVLQEKKEERRYQYHRNKCCFGEGNGRCDCPCHKNEISQPPKTEGEKDWERKFGWKERFSNEFIKLFGRLDKDPQKYAMYKDFENLLAQSLETQEKNLKAEFVKSLQELYRREPNWLYKGIEETIQKYSKAEGDTETKQ